MMSEHSPWPQRPVSPHDTIVAILGNPSTISEIVQKAMCPHAFEAHRRSAWCREAHCGGSAQRDHRLIACVHNTDGPDYMIVHVFPDFPTGTVRMFGPTRYYLGTRVIVYDPLQGRAIPDEQWRALGIKRAFYC